MVEERSVGWVFEVFLMGFTRTVNGDAVCM